MIIEGIKNLLGEDLTKQVETALKGKGKDGKDVDLVIGNDGSFVPAEKYNGANSGKTSAENALKAAAEALKAIGGSGDPAKIAEDVKTAQTTITTLQTNHDAEIKKISKNAALRMALNGKVHDPSDIIGLLDLEKIEAKRAELAEREWARMKENNSATCRSCHNYDAMDHAKQHPEAARQMKVAAKDNQSCIDCHKGIAHQLPDMSSGFRKQFDELRASANDSGDTLYSIDIKPIYAAKGDKEASGSLLPASEVKVLKRDGDWLQIEITGWTESAGRQRVLTQFPGKRIFVASIRGDVQQQVKTLEKTTVADTNTEWSKLQATAWMKKGDMVNDIKPIWAYADSLYNGTCNQCHGAPEIAHFDANGWIGTLNGMIGFTSLDKREERTLLKYLQMNASDTAGKAHGDKKEEK